MATKTDKNLKSVAIKRAPINWWDPDKPKENFGDMLVNHALATSKTVFRGTCRGVLIEEEDERAEEKFFDAITDTTGGIALFAEVPIFGRGTSETFFVWDEGAVRVEMGTDHKYNVNFITVDRQTYIKTTQMLGEFLLPEFVRQPIYSLAAGPQGIEIGEVGIAGVQFEGSNYEQEVVDAFDFIVEDLQRASPLGRLSIIEGDPGTGKTFFIRGLLQEVYDAVFILIPPSMVEDLAGPNLVPTLIRARRMVGIEKPIVLVIEDADKALVPRENESGMANEGTNLAAISALLNASDGILGSALNLRVICTTNAKVEQMDAALLRPGRLSKQIHIGPLSIEKAQEVYARISEGEEATFNEPMSLAQVYDFYKFMDIEQDKEEEEEGDDEVEDEDEDDEDNEDDDSDEDDDDDDDDDED